MLPESPDAVAPQPRSLTDVLLSQVVEMIDSWPPDRCAVGVTDADQTLAVRGRTDWRFDLASVTKVLSTMAVLLATEEGIVTLEEPAGPPGSTLRHLLAHTSGHSLTQAAPIAPPGRRRIYSNVGIELAAGLVEHRAGMSLEQYLSEGVLGPLAMVGTRVVRIAGVRRAQLGRRSPGPRP